MSARSVTRFWFNGGRYTAAAQTTGDYPGTLGYISDARPTTIAAGSANDVFQNTVGPSLTKPTETRATQFIVIERPSCTLVGAGRNKPIINTTSYNEGPDGVSNDETGFPGLAYPFPAGTELDPTTGLLGGGSPIFVYGQKELNQPIYILPGQTFENKFIPLTGVSGATVTGGEGTYTPGDSVASFVTYSVYDGPDALIASKLIEMGYPVSMGNVQWYKRTLLAQNKA